MKCNIIKTKEMKDGSLELQMEVDNEFIDCCVKDFVVRSIKQAIAEDSKKIKSKNKAKKNAK